MHDGEQKRQPMIAILGAKQPQGLEDLPRGRNHGMVQHNSG
jgi:hypothetical protein